MVKNRIKQDVYRVKLKEVLASKYKRGGGVYFIKSLSNDKIYIGSTNCFEKRWATHLLALEYKRHDNYRLQNDYNEFGKDNFVFEKLVCMGRRPNRDLLYDNEQAQIDLLKPQYNIQLIVQRTIYPFKRKGKILKEGVQGKDLKRNKPKKEKKHHVKPKNNAPKPNNFTLLAKVVSKRIRTRPPKKKAYLVEMNKKNDAVNQRWRELKNII